jgi:hypothetical protein
MQGNDRVLEQRNSALTASASDGFVKLGGFALQTGEGVGFGCALTQLHYIIMMLEIGSRTLPANRRLSPQPQHFRVFGISGSNPMTGAREVAKNPARFLRVCPIFPREPSAPG